MLGISGEHQGMYCQKEKGIQFLTQYLSPSWRGVFCSLFWSNSTARGHPEKAPMLEGLADSTLHVLVLR